MADAIHLTPADIADVCLRALDFGLIDHHAIRRWGDSLLLSYNVAPVWAIDLADCSAINVHERLRRVPGACSEDESRKLLLGLASLCWRTGRMTVGTFRGIGWTLYLEDAKGNLTDKSHWGLALELAGENYDDGFEDIGDLHAAADQVASLFDDYRPIVPEWMIGGEPDDARESPT